jgi:hypothetical protein
MTRRLLTLAHGHAETDGTPDGRSTWRVAAAEPSADALLLSSGGERLPAQAVAAAMESGGTPGIDYCNR